MRKIPARKQVTLLATCLQTGILLGIFFALTCTSGMLAGVPMDYVALYHRI
jgi:hypothetical protein